MVKQVLVVAGQRVCPQRIAKVAGVLGITSKGLISRMEKLYSGSQDLLSAKEFATRLGVIAPAERPVNQSRRSRYSQPQKRL
ncbi:hypothetical protein [Spirosoma fluminis]